MSKKKYIFVTGGVVSSLGKGITAASIALLLEGRGCKVGMMKLDPYLNVDPGTMNPFQHGEVYVTDDGAETDLDLGHYSRFTNAEISKKSTATSGQVYETVIKNERRGDYLGNTVQVIPHITNEIKRRIELQDAEINIIEIGGTVGDIESLPFLEAIRQFCHERPGDCINIHLTYVPFLKAAGELKTKPTQHSAAVLREIGIIPDMIVCRCENPLPENVKDKIALFCSVKKEFVIDEPDVEQTVYEVPVELKREKLDVKIAELLGLPKKACNIKVWETMLEKYLGAKQTLTIGLVCKYSDVPDADKSVLESLIHGGIANGVRIKVIPIEADKKLKLDGLDGVLVPGGFGERGFEGKIAAAKYCRENALPYFGICFGMQVMAVEFARNVLGAKKASSTEIDLETPDPVISLLSEQEGVKDLGGTMRLGSYPCSLTRNTKVAKLYGKSVIHERHRHRYEFNNAYAKAFEEKGMLIAGKLKGEALCEILENRDHPWMIAVQFHPELKSKPTDPHPLFVSFIKACKDHGKNRRN
ncbi:MAG: CTP synthase [Simkaniaceae bacterium]|nr:CTP synthase [Simkaniaceae bacterium]